MTKDYQYLLDKFTVLADEIPKSSKRFLHIRSFRNFIYHLDKISAISERELAEKTILSYLGDIEEHYGEADFEYAEYLYKVYFSKILRAYTCTMSFYVVISNKAYLILIPLFFSFVFIFRNSIIFLLILIFPVVGYFIGLMIFSKKNQTHGFCY